MSFVWQPTTVPISAHSFNGARDQIAVSPNSNEVQIYQQDQTNASGWALSNTLTEHDKLVTSIDWAPNTNRIVTCSQDRNAYVWNLTPDPETGAMIWQPTLVLVRLNRSATYVRWSPNEEKFAVASGARTIAICQFDKESDWWSSKHIKKPLRSTVLTVDWHPNSVLLAAGSADGYARVFSAFMKGIDAKPEASAWGERLPFNTVCGEYTSPTGGWVHSVSFSPSGDVLAFASHDSTISVVYPGQGMINVPLPGLPSLSLVFTAEDAIVAAGHDCVPYFYSGSAAGWGLVKSLDQGQAERKVATATGRLNQSEAFNRFRSADSRGISGGATQQAGKADLPSIYQNSITSVRIFDQTRVSTSGVDGRVVIWDV